MTVPFDGRLRVLAFVAGRDPTRDLAGIHAQLRGLGAVLMILADAGAWTFESDAVHFDATGTLPDALAARFEVDRAHDAVVVVDGDERVRFFHAGPVVDVLQDALAAAAHVLAAPTRLTRPHRELVVASVCTGFARALGREARV